MSITAVTIPLLDNTESAGTAVEGTPVRTAHNTFDVQVITAPAALFNLQGSEDKVNWNALSDPSGTAITNVATGWFVVREAPEWTRATISIDASFPRLFTAVAAIHKDA